jgi:tripartite-type tricarboxylate transporter receptor subunit TctC
VRELGYPQLEAGVWLGIFVPTGTPQPIISRLNAEIGKALSDPAAIERIRNFGFEIKTGSPEDLAALVRADTSKWAPVIKRAGINLD